MIERLRRLVPPADELRRNRWLRWMGPALHHPRLWRVSRRGLALGVALGIFFGLLIPVAQIPFSAAAAVVLRANVPGAVASTLVTNPATFGPIYYAAWRLGTALLGDPDPGPDASMPEAAAAPEPVPSESWLGRALRRLAAVGKPLLLGLSILAVGMSCLAYLLVSWGWTLRTRWKRRHRLREALKAGPPK